MRRSPLTALVLLPLAAVLSLSTVAPAQAAPHHSPTHARKVATTVSGWTTTPTSVSAGSTYVERVKVSGGRRALALQRKVGASWRTVASTRSARTGRASLVWKVPTTPGTVALRLSVAAAGRWAGGVTPARLLTIRAKSTGTPAVILSTQLQTVLDLVNAARAAGQTCGGTAYPAVGALRANAALGRAAGDFAELMAERDFFSHDSPNGDDPGDRITDAGYTWQTYGENIAAGQTTPAQVVQGWLASTGHCKNIMNGAFREIGIGYAYDAGSTYGHYWVQDFGTSR